ncbi:MAG: response regulator [Spirochaetes bacterium]|nr:response regulator [Spirochaetota bacterium]
MATRDIRILVVDDEEKIASRISRLLEREGYSVDVAYSGEEAIHKLTIRHYEIVLTDLNMPGKNGFDVMECIQRENLNTLPLVLTGYASIESAITAIKLGAYDFIKKPIDAATLTLVVNRAAERVMLLRENKRHLEELEKLNELKNEFLSVVSHDLRSPLATIGGYVNYLLKKGNLGDFERRYLVIIRDIADNLYQLVNELLDISKLEIGIMSVNREMTDISQIISMSINNFLLLAVDKNNQVVFRNNLLNPHAYIDRMKIMQVMNNLIGNAIKFTENGTITITATELDTHISVSVSDTGVGISSENLEKIFNAYAIHKSSGTRGEKGTGLGLQICKRFIELHGGTIRASSNVGEGSTFEFIIPRRGE